jgi:hypothetical protein
MTLSDESIPQRFVQLALELDKHLPGNVDAYFGPPEWKAASAARGPQPIEELARQAARLAADIDQECSLDDQRRDYLARHVTAMQTSLRLLQGETLPHQSPAQVSAYFQRYGLRTEKEADKAVEFLSDPLSRSYVFTYGYGGKLLDALFAAKGNAAA